MSPERATVTAGNDLELGAARGAEIPAPPRHGMPCPYVSTLEAPSIARNADASAAVGAMPARRQQTRSKHRPLRLCGDGRGVEHLASGLRTLPS